MYSILLVVIYVYITVRESVSLLWIIIQPNLWHFCILYCFYRYEILHILFMRCQTYLKWVYAHYPVKVETNVENIRRMRYRFSTTWNISQSLPICRELIQIWISAKILQIGRSLLPFRGCGTRCLLMGDLRLLMKARCLLEWGCGLGTLNDFLYCFLSAGWANSITGQRLSVYLWVRVLTRMAQIMTVVCEDL